MLIIIEVPERGKPDTTVMVSEAMILSLHWCEGLERCCVLMIQGNALATFRGDS